MMSKEKIMYRINDVKYEDKRAAAEAIDKYLSLFIEDHLKYEKILQEIIENAKTSSFEPEEDAVDSIVRSVLVHLIGTIEKKITKKEIEYQKLFEKKGFDALVKDVNKSIKLYPKVKELFAKSLETLGNPNKAYEVELLKILLLLTQKTAKAFKEQKASNNMFLNNNNNKEAGVEQWM